MYKGSWCVNYIGLHVSLEETLLSVESVSILRLCMLVLSWRIKGSTSTLDLMESWEPWMLLWMETHSWQEDKYARNKSIIWFSCLTTPNSTLGALLFGNWKGGGKVIKGVMDTSYENGGASWSRKFVREKSSGEYDINCFKETRTKHWNFLLKKYQSISSSRNS